MDRNAMTAVHVGAASGIPSRRTRRSAPKKAAFGATERKAAALGGPEVEGSRRDLEGEAGDKEHQPDHRHRGETAGERLCYVRKTRRAGYAVDQDYPVEEHGGCYDARDQVLHPALGALAPAPVEGDHRVGRYRRQLYGEEETEQISHRDEEYGAEDDREDEGQVLPCVARVPGPARRRQDREERRGGHDQLEVQREAVDHEPAPEEAAREPDREQHRRAPEHCQGTEGRQPRDEPDVPLGEHPDHEDEDQKSGRDELRKEREEGLTGYRH
jgi:hypothetical protein